jgi:5'-3' exonuclease
LQLFLLLDIDFVGVLWHLSPQTNVSQLDMKGTFYDHQGVIKKMGVRPDQILDLLALTGDSADNIPLPQLYQRK